MIGIKVDWYNEKTGVKNQYKGNSKKGEIEITKEKLIYENQYGILYDDDVFFPTGVSGKYIRFLWKAPYTVAVLPIMKDGQIALISSFRHALRDWILEIPKGFGEKYLEPMKVAQRELLEETGLNCSKINLVREIIIDPGLLATKMILFVAYGCIQYQKPNPEDHEAIESIKIYNLDEIYRLIAEEGIKDSVTLIALLEYLKNRRI